MVDTFHLLLLTDCYEEKPMAPETFSCLCIGGGSSLVAMSVYNNGWQSLKENFWYNFYHFFNRFGEPIEKMLNVFGPIFLLLGLLSLFL